MTMSFVSTAFAAAALATTPTVPTPLVDHHLHIFSPAASRAFKRICTNLGPGHCPEGVNKEPATGRDALDALDRAHIQQGTLLSGAYFFASPSAGTPEGELANDTRAENAYIVAQARSSCGRLIPFISVNPLWEGAVAEIDHWGRAGGAVGLKLHLGNSRIDLRSPEQIKKIAAVFTAANRNRLAIAIHLQTAGANYGPEDVRTFIKEILPQAKDVIVQVAHIGSGGGLDAGVLENLHVFALEIKQHPAAHRNLFFDLAMVPDLFSNQQKLPASAADSSKLAAVMRDLGIRRFLPASDYTLGLDLDAYYANQKAAMKLTDAEWAKLRTVKAPYVHAMAPCAILPRASL